MVHKKEKLGIIIFKGLLWAIGIIIVIILYNSFIIP